MPVLSTRRVARRRVVPLVALAAVPIAVVALLTGGASYSVNVRFQNAGQLVKGGLVQVAGNKIGSVSGISIADNGEANIELEITDERFSPFRRGTRARIRSVGQATITNRYIDIDPGPDNAPEIPDGGVLASTDAAGIVDLDQILNAVDDRTREDIRGLLRNSSQLYAGSGGRWFNTTLHRLSPAVQQLSELTADLASDQADIKHLIRSGAVAARAVASRPTDLDQAVTGTAQALSAISAERVSLADAIARAPSVLRQARGTLRNVGATASSLRPTLRAVPPVQGDLRSTLRRLPPSLDAAGPALDDLRSLLPAVQRTLDGARPLAAPTVSALEALQDGMEDSREILEGVRFYGSDLILGVVNGLVALATGQYNNQGHFVQIEFVQSPQTALGGIFSPVFPGLTKGGLVPNVLNTQTDQRSRCPGANVPPAPDGSAPYLPKPGICDPAQNMSPLVNSPTANCVSYRECTPGATARRGTAKRGRAGR